MNEFVEITLRLPVVTAAYPAHPEDDSELTCRRCNGKPIGEGERAYKFDRYWICETCKDNLPAQLGTQAAWVVIADHISERPGRQKAATIRAVLANMAAMVRRQWQ